MSVPNDRAHRGHHSRKGTGSAQRHLAIRSISELKRASSRDDLSAYSLLEYLALDGRPSFAVNFSSPHLPHAPLELVYCNPALAKDHPDLLEMIKEREPSNLMFSEIHAGFRAWLFSPDVDGAETTSSKGSYIFERYLWSSVTVDHYTVASGVPCPDMRSTSVDPREHREPKHLPKLVQEHLPSVPGNKYISSLDTDHGPFDYTLKPLPGRMSEHVEYFYSVDWASTPLGPILSWSSQLRCVVNMVLNDCRPAVLFWGKEVIMIYNESYIELLGLLHPCMGVSAKVAARDYWDIFQPLVDHINVTGQTLSEVDMPLFLDRHGFLEETFFSFQFVPILDSHGYVAGYYQPLVETTKNKLLERRVSSLVEVGSQTAKARDLEAYWELVLNTLKINDKDAPFALLYATEQTSGSSTMQLPGMDSGTDQCYLKGSIGVTPGHPIAQRTIDFQDGSNIFIPYLLKAAKSRRPTLLHFEELEMATSMLEGIEWKGYGDPCRCVIICPVQPTSSKQLLGFLILGVNPRRPFDTEYQQFVHVMNRLLATSLASVVLFEDELRQKESAIDQAARLQEQLLAELKLKEKKLIRWAERFDVAIFIMDPLGNYTYRNQRWFDIFRVSHENVMSSWESVVFPEDISVCESLFAKLVVEKVPISFELKTKMKWNPPTEVMAPDDETPEYCWILCSAYPELGPGNDLLEIVGNVTDISKQKWAEGVQKRRTDSALEAKRHLECFIDTTSHEMRNPLSAIMLCADGILSSYLVAEEEQHLSELSPSSVSPENHAEFMDLTLDSAQTIAQCAQHMKRIVDDILTISKLDSGLLVMTPVDSQPEAVGNHAVKMFEGEAKAADVELSFVVEQTYRDLALDWVSLDPTRLLQVLINLITNAVKFTRLESKRRITVRLSASLTEPVSIADGIQFIDTKLVAEDSQLKDDWERGSTVFLQFSVVDTGRGLTNEEKCSLFARFSQASPRTHIHYGGSGLGLFISRRLTELQGGGIGLASQPNEGSTFCFYIKGRKIETPPLQKRGVVPTIFPEDMKHRPGTPNNETDQSPTHPNLGRRLSTKQVSVPLNIPAEIPENTVETPASSPEKTPPAPEVLHVLVVEDNLVNQKVLARQLRNLGCIVSVANHGVEALKFLEKTKYWVSENGNVHSPSPTLKNGYHGHNISETKQPDARTDPSDPPVELSLILMDWEMPVMDGLTAVAKIRELQMAQRLLSHIPVIGVTANVREQQIQMAIDAGMDDVVGKPFKVVELLSRMKGVVAGTGGLRASLREPG